MLKVSLLTGILLVPLPYTDSTVHDDIMKNIYASHKKEFFHKLYRTVDTGYHNIFYYTYACCNLSFVCILFRKGKIWSTATLWYVDHNGIVFE